MDAAAAEDLALDALEWLGRQGSERGEGLSWPGRVDVDEDDPTLYSGAAGIVTTLLEAHRHTGDVRFADAAVRGARGIAGMVGDWGLSSLYFGLTGMAFALQAVDTTFGDPTSAAAARRALSLVRDRFDGERWSDQFELLGGNAGVALGALAVGDLDLAVLAVTPYLRTAEPTAGGVHWEVRLATPARFHHISHGTLGIVYALAAVGQASGRRDLLDLGLAGAADVLSRNGAGDDGFLVSHSDPQHKPELIERYSFGWCHGPTGDAQVFRLLGHLTGDPSWATLVDRCWHTVITSGLPQRLRPGFWDNSGHCCGTAGVLALACDLHTEGRTDLAFARTLAGDLDGRAIRDADGTRWSNYEHRVTPSDLPPRTGWAMGSAGIVRELLRFSRLASGGADGYAVTWPDHPSVAVPAADRVPESRCNRGRHAQPGGDDVVGP